MGGDEAAARVAVARPVHYLGWGCSGYSGAAVSEGYQVISLDLAYEGQSVRVVGTPERPEWVAADVCAILEIASPASSMRGFPESAKGMHTMQTPGGPQQMLTVTEGGLYRLVSFSRKPEAERFRNWVFDEVLPSLRQHGQYPPPGALTVQEKQRERSLTRAEFESVLLPLCEAISQMREELRGVLPPRHPFPVSATDWVWKPILQKHYQGCDPSDLETPLLDANGDWLPCVRFDHFLGRSQNGVNEGWPVSVDNNNALGQPGSPQRQAVHGKFVHFQELVKRELKQQSKDMRVVRAEMAGQKRLFDG